MPPLYSHSRLNSFENCPKQFHFRYELKVPTETEGVEAFVGKRVHEVLERLYRFVDQGLVPGVEKVVSRFRALWEEHFDAERIRIVRDHMSPEEYRQLGERCLRNYYRRHYPFDADRTLGLEQRVVFSLDPAGRYRMQGIVDRVVRAPDGTIEIHDYKTGARVPTQKALDADRQLALYQIGMAERYGPEERYRLVWHYLASGQIRTSVRTPDQLDALRSETAGLIDRIEAETEYATRTSALCRWCEYRSLCPAWQEPGTEAPAPVPTPAAGGSTQVSSPTRAPATKAQGPPGAPGRDPQLDLL